VWPLVKNWPTAWREHDGRSYKFFEKERVVLVCGGMGAEAARRAAEAMISLYHPVLVISAGFAGGLDPSLPVGHTLNPRQVIDACDGSRVDSGSGEGVLVTFETAADAGQKAKLATAFGAHAVDMEAAAVARSAEAHGIKFLACKVISDPHDSRLPPIMRFVGPDGRFDAAGFLLHVAIRPWLWRGVVQLARNSSVAARTLCEALGGTTSEAAEQAADMLVGAKT
ncbi:MAG TPA: hypothetical protein VH744_11990, partial [Terriglobales bacterium]